MTDDELYELFVGQLYACQRSWPDTLMAPVPIFHRRSYLGRHTGNSHQIDLSFTVELGGLELLVVFECKHYRRRVGKEAVEQLHSTMSDIGAHKGCIVTTVGFQKGALKAARAYGIALVIATVSEEWFKAPGQVNLFNPEWTFMNHGASITPFSGPWPIGCVHHARWLIRGLIESMRFERGDLAALLPPNVRPHLHPHLPSSVRAFAESESDDSDDFF